jgi:hypothetical protein
MRTTYDMTGEDAVVRNADCALYLLWQDDDGSDVDYTGHVVSLKVWRNESGHGDAVLVIDSDSIGGVILPHDDEKRIYFLIPKEKLALLDTEQYWYQMLDAAPGGTTLLCSGKMQLFGPAS